VGKGRTVRKGSEEGEQRGSMESMWREGEATSSINDRYYLHSEAYCILLFRSCCSISLIPSTLPHSFFHILLPSLIHPFLSHSSFLAFTHPIPFLSHSPSSSLPSISHIHPPFPLTFTISFFPSHFSHSPFITPPINKESQNKHPWKKDQKWKWGRDWNLQRGEGQKLK